jgi:hypothetical protein
LERAIENFAPIFSLVSIGFHLCRSQVKKLRKTLRTSCKDSDYFLYPGTDDKIRLDRVEHVEVLCEKLEMEELEALCNSLNRVCGVSSSVAWGKVFLLRMYQRACRPVHH